MLAESQVFVGEVIPDEDDEFGDERREHVVDVYDFCSEPNERSVEPESGEIDSDEARVLAELVRPGALEGKALVHVERRRSDDHESYDDGLEIMEMGELRQSVEDGEIGYRRGTSDQKELEELRKTGKESVEAFDLNHESGVI